MVFGRLCIACLVLYLTHECWSIRSLLSCNSSLCFGSLRFSFASLCAQKHCPSGPLVEPTLKRTQCPWVIELADVVFAHARYPFPLVDLLTCFPFVFPSAPAVAEFKPLIALLLKRDVPVPVCRAVCTILHHLDCYASLSFTHCLAAEVTEGVRLTNVVGCTVATACSIAGQYHCCSIVQP